MSARFWARNKAQREDVPTEAMMLPRGWRLGAADRCDRCGAQAYVRVVLPGRLELLFCAHHNRQYAAALAKIAVEILDETQRLAAARAA